jgi:hypothetical protein
MSGMEKPGSTSRRTAPPSPTPARPWVARRLSVLTKRRSGCWGSKGVLHGSYHRNLQDAAPLTAVRRNDMASHMKTTVHISDGLLADAQELARQEKTTLKAMIEEGLSRVVAERKSRAPFRLRDASFRGQGLQPEFADAPWEKIRAAIDDDAR